METPIVLEEKTNLITEPELAAGIEPNSSSAKLGLEILMN
jgi:hypothetical protein